jgi:hypothetical protein
MKMNKYIKHILAICLLAICLYPAFCSQIQIHAEYDSKKVLTGYEVWTWDGPDQAMIRTKYTIEDAESKFGSLLNSQELGTSKTPDRIFLNYDDDGNLKSVTAQVTSITAESFETNDKSADTLSAKTVSDAVATKVDVATKEATVDKTADVINAEKVP